MKEDNNKELVRPQTADGIQEFDNELPDWWVKLFILTTAIGIAYAIYLHGLGGTTLIETYNQDLADMARKSEWQNRSAQTGGSTSEAGDGRDFAARLADPEYVADGKNLYMANCVACHAADGGGGIGPNLADKYWLHGNTPEAIYKVIAEGVLAKGMVGWEPVLGRGKVEKLTAFVLSLVGSTPVAPKAPQGDAYD